MGQAFGVIAAALFGFFGTVGLISCSSQESYPSPNEYLPPVSAMAPRTKSVDELYWFNYMRASTNESFDVWQRTTGKKMYITSMNCHPTWASKGRAVFWTDDVFRMHQACWKIKPGFDEIEIVEDSLRYPLSRFSVAKREFQYHLSTRNNQVL